MDIEDEVLVYLARLPVVRDWPELQDVVRRAALPNAAVWALPRLACEAVGGRASQAVPAVAALACLQISIILIDDLLDADPRGEYHRLGQPAAANLAIGLQAAGLQAVTESEATPATRLAVLGCLNGMMLATALGQHWDTQNPLDEDAYWRLVAAKSSPFFGAALEAGALFGGASPAVGAGLRRLGLLYGELIQIHDDLHDTMAVPAGPDWTQGRSTLPMLFGQLMPHPDQERFIALRQSSADPQALAEAQTILMRCGAVSYCLDELGSRYERAVSVLRELSLAHPAGLESLLETQIRPVKELLRMAAVEDPALGLSWADSETSRSASN
jgi:geranylgeranyl pyrophosphate synthase